MLPYLSEAPFVNYEDLHFLRLISGILLCGLWNSILLGNVNGEWAKDDLT